MPAQCTGARTLLNEAKTQGGKVTVAQIAATLSPNEKLSPKDALHKNTTVAIKDILANDPGPSKLSPPVPGNLPSTATTDISRQQAEKIQINCGKDAEATKLLRSAVASSAGSHKHKFSYVVSVLIALAIGIATEALCMMGYGVILAVYAPALAAITYVTEACYFISSFVDSYVFQVFSTGGEGSSRGQFAWQAFVDALAVWVFFRGLDLAAERLFKISLSHFFASFGLGIAAMVRDRSWDLGGKMTVVMQQIAQHLGHAAGALPAKAVLGKHKAGRVPFVFVHLVTELNAQRYGNRAQRISDQSYGFIVPLDLSRGQRHFWLTNLRNGCLTARPNVMRYETCAPLGSGLSRAQTFTVFDNLVMSDSGACLGNWSGGRNLFGCGERGVQNTSLIDVALVPVAGQGLRAANYEEAGWNLSQWEARQRTIA